MDWEPRAKRHLNLCYGKNAFEDKAEYMKEYRRKYREQRSQIIQCECGARFQELCKYSHKFSNRHEIWLRTQGEQDKENL